MSQPWSLAGALQTFPKEEVGAGLGVLSHVQMLSGQAALPSPMFHSADRMDTAPRHLYSPPQGHVLQGSGGAWATSTTLWILTSNKADKTSL